MSIRPYYWSVAQKSSSNDPRAFRPEWRAVKHLPSNSGKSRRETGIFAEGDVEIKDSGQQNWR